MREVTVKMLIGFGGSQESVDFVVSVADDWAMTEENLSSMYADFRHEATLDIEDVECSECGYSIGQCECGDGDEEA